MSPERPPLPALTGIRFLAAMHVVFFHYAPAGLPRLLQNAVRNGELAVGLFFVLSGFVLAYNYAGRTVDLRKFWLARFARIYPAYLLGFLLIAPAVIIRLQDDPPKLAAAGLAAAALLQGWLPGLSLVWNGPGWSLSNEAFFYLLFPLMLPLLEKRSSRDLWIVAAACCLAAAAVGEAFLYVPLFRLPEFVLGIAAGLLFLHGVRLTIRLPLAMLAIFAILPPDSFAAGLRNAIAAPIFALLVSAVAANRGVLLCSRPMLALGDASYAVYILQSPVTAYFQVATQGWAASGIRSQMDWTQFAAYCTVLIAASLVCYAWLEVPARSWILQPPPEKKMVPSDPISSLAHHRHARH